MDYTQSIAKATALIRELEIDDALDILHRLLKEFPLDIELINRIYSLEVKRPGLSGFDRICDHIFSISAKGNQYRNLIYQSFGDYLRLKNGPPKLNEKTKFNLFLQLGESHFVKQVEAIKDEIKKDSADHPKTPLLLQVHCEQLIKQKKLILARKELKYIIAFYAETEPGKWALRTKKMVEAEIK